MIDELEKAFGKKIFLLLASFTLVALGQPAWIGWMGAIASLMGFALFWRVVLTHTHPLQRFLLGFIWAGCVELFHLSWTLSHPFWYIYVAWFGFSAVIGIQFGIVCLFVTRENLLHLGRTIGVVAIATLMEWSRLFIFSGYSWNPAGLALTPNPYSMQFASLGGVFGLSFWVYLTNALGLHAWMSGFKKKNVALWITVALVPYVFGIAHHKWHAAQLANHSHHIAAILVQPAFPAEEAITFSHPRGLTYFVIDEWRHIFSIVEQHRGKETDLIVLPEMVVPFGAYTFMFPYHEVRQVFLDTFGPRAVSSLPDLELPLAVQSKMTSEWYVNNAYWAQGLANLMDSDVVVGLEDAARAPDGTREYYSGALQFRPDNGIHDPNTRARYEKRILVPLGEYIPFDFLKTLAAQYGVLSSFTPGKEAKIWDCGDCPYGVSICYEETFGDVMRENRLKGANMLVNLTSDVWYPNSRLTRQHLDLARLRTVENGIPLLRACNTGITCALNSLGQEVAMLGDGTSASESIADSLYVKVPTYHYQTLYSQLGDGLVIGFALLGALLFFRKSGV